MIKKILCILTIQLFLISSLHASIAYNPDAPVIVDYEGELYMVKDIEVKEFDKIENLESKLIPKTNWKKIIASSNPKTSKLLLIKLSSYLPKNELWPFIKEGLLRKENKLGNLVADTAYKSWSVFATPDELLEIRTDPLYRRNLSVLSRWNYMFLEPSKEFNTLDKAVEKIELLFSKTSEVDYANKRLLKELRTTIALSTELDQHKQFVRHENFHIALSSMYAISKLNPKEHSFEILSDAVFDNEIYEYDYWFLDVGSNGFINLGQAAYDLFSDYLTEKQLIEVVATDTLAQDGQRRLNIRTDKLARAMLPYKKERNSVMFHLQDWELQQKIRNYSLYQLKKLLQKRNVYDYMTDELFSKTVYLALIEISYENNSMDDYYYYDWAQAAFRVHNEYARKFIEEILNGKNPNINKIDTLEFFKFQRNWPKDWQDLKTRAQSITDGIDFDED